MRKSHCWLMGATAALSLSLALPVGAAEVWESPGFTASARELQSAATAIKREAATDVVVLLDERSYTFDEQHRVTMTSRMIYRVDSPTGVENWAASSASWQPWYQASPVIRARVVTPDGREHTLDQKLLRDSAARRGDNQVYDDTHVTEGPLPAVEVGSVIEEEITLRDEKPFFAAGTVYREYIGRPVPVLHTRVIIDAPESLSLKRTTRLLPDASSKETRANGRVRWVMEQGVIDAREAMAPNLPSDQPSWSSVEFSTGASWEAVAANYLELTEPRIRKDDARPLLPKSALPKSASREYIAKLVEKLHREVRYTGVEFGEARLIPEFPAETLRRKFGDCKDKSTLLVAALRASGIEAYLALLSAGSGQDVMPDLPGLGMFDHAIVYVPASVPGGEDLWIDATTEHARVGTLPAADANRLALVIRPGEKALIRTPAMKSADNMQIETREFHLAEYGAARVVETTETRGTIELEYRGWYAGADTKERLDSLQEYAETTYRAKKLAKYTHTASDDFSDFYRMSLDITDAPVGSTDLGAAAVGVSLGNVATRLPVYFTEQLDEDDAPVKPRREDVVFEPYVIEWRYHVHAPDGFQSRPLPANATQQLGPARLTSEYTLVDGVVQAHWRFDTVKGRYTPAEAEAFIKAVRELKRREVLLLAFDHQGAALRAEGDFKGSLEVYRTLAGKHPKQAVHRLRHAYALLEAGLGTRAHLEAQAATKLEPKYAFAWKVQGWMLQHDAVGRRFGAGFDRAGAIAAYRKARALDPENADIAADLGVLLEHDARGERYADKASLELAVSEYLARARLMDSTKSDRYTDNLYYSLLYLRRFDEARDLLKKENPTSTRRALSLAAIAGAEGSAKAIEAAVEIAGSEAERRTALKSAGGLLTNLREYGAAADLLEASARGQSTTAADAQRVALLRKVSPAERDSVQVTDPRSVVLRAYSLLLSANPRDEDFRALSSRHAQEGVDTHEDYVTARRTTYTALTRQETPFDVAADLVYGNLRVTVEGDDARGYRAQVRGSGMSTNYYVVKENGIFKLLAVGALTGPLARAALERLDAGDIEGARQWLDWARLEQRVANSEDPLVGNSFSRFYVVGGQADAADLRSAAAMLLADSNVSAGALPLLLAAQTAARSDAEKLSLDLSLAHVYQELEMWPQLEQVATRLTTAWPNSGLAFHFQQWARIQLKHWDAVTAAAKDRLARLPDDMTAVRVLVESADARGAHAEMLQLMEPVITSPRANSVEFNEYAWISLLQKPVPERAVEIARQAFDETQGREGAIAHTLACVYAATGKPREARDLLLKNAARVANTEELDDATWFGFGMVAEAYGDSISARDYYAHVQKPKKGMIQSSSVYAMAQARLKTL